eukprot:Blabericola_migrator_1__13034@NODE_875_length_6200_cov_91_101745_g619_i0_p2_GENE_NODE_875_length_6200_cov_91_101745_g619_i0NODE_875_length_6200_cov_91_101745_g619_i0_p2_ORF_typecomplete_len564_score71_44SWIRM/PF04433_17/3_1e15Myb_DNAbind_6/PF13921_6/0_026Myb_DNAbinding/PF00249_31/0_093_NODE_875_length_6200_cov_91_101745_g619_i037385429
MEEEEVLLQRLADASGDDELHLHDDNNNNSLVGSRYRRVGGKEGLEGFRHRLLVASMPTLLHFNCRPSSNASTTLAVESAELVGLKTDESDMDEAAAQDEHPLSEIAPEDLQALQESLLPHALKEDLMAAATTAPQDNTPIGRPAPPSIHASAGQEMPPNQDMPTPASSLYKLPDAPPPEALQAGGMHMGASRQMSLEAMGGPPPLPAQMRPPPPGMPGLMPGGPHPGFPQVPVVSMPPGGQMHAGFPGATAPPFPPCPWFDPTAITQEEVDELKVSFPSLRVCRPAAENDRNNLAYLTLRNTLIDVYRSNPGQKLTLAECRKHCDGDLAALLRVLSFLERNRLVNFCIDTSQAPTGGLTDTRLRNELAKQWGRTPTCTACDRICLYSFYILSPSAYGASVPLPYLKAAVWCPDCAREAPHNQFLLKVNLPALHVSGGAASWSEPQINVLFDAVESHGSDWIQVSKAVSSVPGNPIRSPRECLAAFLSMPITEPVQAVNVPLKESVPPANAESKGDTTTSQSVESTKESAWDVKEHDPAAVSMGLDILMTAIDVIKGRTTTTM